MDGVYSQKTDVYSVGIVLWEIAMRILTGLCVCERVAYF